MVEMVDTVTTGTPASWGKRGTAAATFAARVQFRNICHSYGDTQTLKDVSFDLNPGEIVCLLGPSGCGKSTLLRIAAGLERQSSGRIFMNNQEIAGPDSFLAPEKRGIGLVFQDFALFPHKSILENVTFGLTSLGKSQSIVAAKAALKRVGMSQYENAYPYVLSGGEQQRVALARAIAPRPLVLLMDEPFSGLDQRLRDNVRDETLAVLKETSACSLLVTHDPEEAMRMADRIILMREGNLVQVGTPKELYTSPVDIEAARFFCDFNELEGVVEAGHIETAVGRIDSPDLATGTHMNILVRPQGLTLSTTGEGLDGRIGNVRFLGECSLIDIHLANLDNPVQARIPGEIDEKQGDMIKILVDPSQIFAFPRKDN